MAGLDDDHQILNSFCNLAGSLCARLCPSAPKHLLDAKQHNTLRAPTNLMNLTFINDNNEKVLLVWFGHLGCATTVVYGRL
jgi:hypothetical protein